MLPKHTTHYYQCTITKHCFVIVRGHSVRRIDSSPQFTWGFEYYTFQHRITPQIFNTVNLGESQNPLPRVAFFNGIIAIFRNQDAIFLRFFGNKIARIVKVYVIIHDLVAILSRFFKFFFFLSSKSRLIKLKFYFNLSRLFVQ